VMPRLREIIPGVRLRIVGRNPIPEVCALSRLAGVEVVGTVPEIGPELASASLLAVPLDSGGGTRLKILEAFAAGLPVVSTRIGCEGLDVENQRHLLVASREQFVPAISSLLGDEARATRLSIEARSLASRQYDWKLIGERAADAALSICNLAHAQATGAPVMCPAAQTSQT
jgi:polysaccharide biosynthesis protein PslH